MSMSAHRTTVRAVLVALVSGGTALAGLTVAAPATGGTGDTAWTAGLNSSGQLGNGTFNNRPSFGAVNALGNVDEIAGGREHALGRIGGQGWGGGGGSEGATGQGTLNDQPTPKLVALGGNATSIAGGHYSSYAVLNDGTVRAWGFNANGQLGDGTTTRRKSPVSVKNLSGVTQVAAGRDMAMALVNGSVRIWGRGTEGQLGNGTNPTVQSTPVTVSLVNGAFDNVVQVAGGRDHVLALKSDGSVWAWGENTYGQVGDGTKTNRNRPVHLTGLSNVVDVAAGAEFSLALLANGTVMSWGRGNAGQLGRGGTTTRVSPGAVGGLPAIANVAAGRAHALAMTSGGALWGWGQDTYGQLGDRAGSNRLTPVQITGVSGVEDAHGGFGYSVILRPSP